MGIESVFQKAAVTIASVFDGIFVPVTYVETDNDATSIAYDASSGVVSVSTTTHSVKMMFQNYSKYEVDNANIMPIDVRGIIPQNNLTPTPKFKDYIKRTEANASTIYDIIDIRRDPAEGMWEFQLRKR